MFNLNQVNVPQVPTCDSHPFLTILGAIAAVAAMAAKYPFLSSFSLITKQQTSTVKTSDCSCKTAQNSKCYNLI